MNKRKRILIIIFTLMLVLIPVCAVALSGDTAVKPVSSGTEYVSETLDRVDFSLDATSFTFPEKQDGKEYEFSFVFSIRKTEADFYARIDSAEITGIDYKSVVFEALSSTPDIPGVNGTVLSAENSQPTDYSWRVTVKADSLPENAFFSLDITSGMTALTSMTRKTQIPLTFSFASPEETTTII